MTRVSRAGIKTQVGVITKGLGAVLGACRQFALAEVLGEELQVDLRLGLPEGRSPSARSSRISRVVIQAAGLLGSDRAHTKNSLLR